MNFPHDVQVTESPLNARYVIALIQMTVEERDPSEGSGSGGQSNSIPFPVVAAD
jgi:hypothetical protein